MSESIDMTAGVYRYVYSGYLRSKRVCALTMAAEAWFWRIHAAADDYGNLPGDYCELRNLCAGRRDMPIVQIESLTKELAEAGLVVTYEADGDRWLHVVGWLRRQPARRDGRRIRRYAVWEGEARESDGAQLPRLFRPPPGAGLRRMDDVSHPDAVLRHPDPSSCSPKPSSPSDSDSDSEIDSDTNSNSAPEVESGGGRARPSRKPTKNHTDYAIVKRIFDAYPVGSRTNRTTALTTTIPDAIEWLRDSPDAPEAARDDPSAWLLAQTVAYANSHMGRTYPKRADRWFGERDYLCPPETWATRNGSAPGETPEQAEQSRQAEEFRTRVMGGPKK